ncbi:MAG: hypothetical protein JXA77_13570 [Bacteroidales bacterium]|nr:hypothetical protein [Bacteroidales bacterium]
MILEWQWYKDLKTSHLFKYLLLTANFKEVKYRGLTLKHGQLVTHLKELSENTGLSLQSVRTSLGKLETSGDINKISTNKYTLITICSYDVYIALEEDDKKVVTFVQQTTNKQTTKKTLQLSEKERYSRSNNEYKNKNENNSLKLNSKFDRYNESPPTLQEVIDFFLQYKQSLEDAQHCYKDFDGWNWKSKIGRCFIPDWKEQAKRFYFKKEQEMAINIAKALKANSVTSPKLIIKKPKSPKIIIEKKSTSCLLRAGSFWGTGVSHTP